MKLQEDLREFVGCLNAENVDYMIVGAHGPAYHGHSRYTGDLDALQRPSKENVERVLSPLDTLSRDES